MDAAAAFENVVEELNLVEEVVEAEELDGEDEDVEDDDEALVEDIDRINQALGIDRPWVVNGERRIESDSDSDDLDWKVNADCEARASGFLDDEDVRLPTVVKTSDIPSGTIVVRGADGNGAASTIGGCDLSQDIYDLELAQSEPSLENCLCQNRAYQEFIVSVIDYLEVLLLKNREEQKYAQERLNMVYGGGKLKNGALVSMRKLKIPYFKIASGLMPPPNEDVKLKTANQELPTLMRIPRLWTVTELSILENEVEKSAFELILQPIMARKEILLEELEHAEKLPAIIVQAKQAEYVEKDKQLKALELKAPAAFVSESRDKNYDWMKISVFGFDGQRSPRDCELYWKNYVHPSITKTKWSKEELAELKRLVSTHGLNSWDLIASELKTNRLAVQCAEKHHSGMNHRLGQEFCFTETPWSVEEKEELMNAVELCRIGDYIPFHIVSYMIEGRSSTEIWRQWVYVVDPSIRRGKWTEEEDTLLLTAVWLLGAKNWFNIKNFVKSRTDVQCYDRWKNCLDPSLKYKEFTRTEDRRLLELVKKHGKKWAVIGKELGRTDNRCSIRYKSLIAFKKKNPSEDAWLGTLPRKQVELYRKRLYKNVAARLKEISDEFGESLSILRIRRIFSSLSAESHELTAGEMRLGELLKKCHIEGLIEAMKQKPEQIGRIVPSVEKGIQEFFRFSLKRRRRGRPPKILNIEDDNVVYQDAVHDLHGILYGRHDAPSGSPSQLPILPPMTATMQAFRNMLLMRNRLGLMGNVKTNFKRTDLTTQAVDSVNPAEIDERVMGTSPAGISYDQLFEQFAALFAWPALLSSIQPPEEPLKPSTVTCSRKRGRKRTVGVVKDTEFKCFAKPTGDAYARKAPPPIRADDCESEVKPKRGRPLNKDRQPKIPTRQSARTRNTKA